MTTALNIPVRMRRLRHGAERRRLFREVDATIEHLVQPYFVVSGKGILREAKADTGLIQLSADRLVEEVKPLIAAGVGGIMLFGVPDEKSDDASKLDAQMTPLIEASERFKSAWPDSNLFADVCLCSYSSTGHCGIVEGHHIANDASVEALCDMALRLARAGVDFVSPSDMMDGRVAAIRKALDAAGLTNTGILSYAVKMASAMYGPFRHAADSKPQFGDRKSYQMPANNRREALRELALDEAEGADALLIKPALTNLDLLRDAREQSKLPLFAYQVSGEYAMLKAAGNAGLVDFDAAIAECLVSMRRAGADVIVSYHARALAHRA